MVINTEVIFCLYGIVNDFTDNCTGTVQTRDRTSWRHCTYIASKVAELPTRDAREAIERDTGPVPMIDIDHSACSISSCGDYSRAASISFRACSGAAIIRERRLFESSVYLVIYGRP